MYRNVFNRNVFSLLEFDRKTDSFVVARDPAEKTSMMEVMYDRLLTLCSL